MATKTAVIPSIDLSFGHRVGINLGAIPEREADIVAGFKVARESDLIELRKARNIAVRAQIKAQLLTDLSV